MKKTLVLLTGILIAGYLNGQVSIGLAAGSTFYKVNQTIEYGSNPDIVKPEKHELSLTSGFAFGIPVEIGLSDKLSLFSVLCYMQKGSGIEEVEPESDNIIMKIKGSTTYNYFEVPVLMKYYFIKKRLNLSADFGPAFGYLYTASANYDYTEINTYDHTSVTDNQKSKFSSKDVKNTGINRFDISLTLGLGLDYKIGIGKVFIHVNYEYGINNMMKGADFPYIDIKQFNRGLNTMLGYMISLKK